MAVVLLGLVAVGIGKAMSAAAQAAHIERRHAVAQMLAANTIARLRAAGPGIGLAADTTRVNDEGVADSTGMYTIVITAATACNGGADLRDNSAVTSIIPVDCSATGQRATLQYEVAVSYPALSPRQPGAAIRYTLTLGDRTAYGQAYAAP